MKITRVESIPLQFKSAQAHSDAIHTFQNPAAVVTKVHTDDGVTGWARTYFGSGQRAVPAFMSLLEEALAPVIVGEDPFFSRRIRKKLWDATEYFGVAGLTHWAIAALDICVWDIVGKGLRQPLFRLLGAERDRIPAYAMVGWYYDDLALFKERCVAVVEEGFRAVKIKVGRAGIDDDVSRFEAAREAVGPAVRIMVDANQAFDEIEALRRGRVYQELGAYWYEEPLRPHRKDALARIAAELDIPIATGENDYTKYAYLDLLRQGAVDIIQPDNRRSGGVTEWIEIGALAAAWDVPVASHGGGATNVHLLCSMPTAAYLESGSLKGAGAHTVQLTMENGEILCPEEPGVGSELKEEYVERHRADR